MIASEIRQLIEHKIEGLESKHEIRVLYACESGSRAWGFESANSDYDVRFIYVRPRDWYLSINLEHRRDVIELPIVNDLDINGWDLRKALKLFAKSNPPLCEWLFSPIIYREQGPLATQMREMTKDVYNLASARYHYLSMAKNNFREFLQGESVIRKKYLYVLRPLLAVIWIENELDVVPIRFDELIERTVFDDPLRGEINELLRLKQAGLEMDRGSPFPRIQSFVEGEIKRHESKQRQLPVPQFDLEKLDVLFREMAD